MSGAQTWIVRVTKEDWDAADYGSPIQVLVAAATPEEARALASDMLGQPAHTLLAVQHSLGASADDAAQ